MNAASSRATVCPPRRSKPIPMRSICFPLILAGCTASAEEVRPPADQLFFPTGAAVSPDDQFLFVANGNSELRYDSGSISVIDLNRVDAYVNDWITAGVFPDGCQPDPDRRETLQCPESFLMITEAGARVGNFATDISVQDTGGGTARLFVPTRGDPSVAWVDWDGGKLSCNNAAQGFALCDEAHRLSYVGNNPDVGLMPDEPFDSFADSAGQFAVITHLTSGAVTLIDSPIGADAVIADVLDGLFLPDELTGLRGTTGIAGRAPTLNNDIIYVGSRAEDRIQMLTVGRPVSGQRPSLIPGNYFFLNLVGGTSGGSTDSRSISFSPTGDRMYLINRRPPSLQIYDTSLGATGFPKNVGIGATDICRQASTLSVMDTGDGERAYVTCFQDGQLYIVDPRGIAFVEDIVLVGRGPYSVVASPARKKIFVTNFLEDTVAVIDVSPTSAFYNRVVLRIGDVRPL